MKTKKIRNAAHHAILMLITLISMTTLKAQEPGSGVDPKVIMLDDFENGSTSKWSWKPFGRGEKASVELASAANGDPVRYGNYALKFNIDFTEAQAGQTLPANLSPGMSRPSIIIPGNDGTTRKRIGMWVYATPGIQGMWMRVATRANNATSGVTNTDLASSINWIGWKYVQCDLPNNHEFHPDGIRFLVTKSFTNYYVNGYVIIDNIRVTELSFNEDLTPPSINSLLGNETPLSGTYNTSKINLFGTFSEVGSPSSGINYKNIQIKVDGRIFKSGDNGFIVDQTTNSVTLTGLRFPNGTHNVEMQVEDNFGHITTKSSTFSVLAEDLTTVITAEPDAQAYVGNPFRILVKSNAPKDVKELKLVIELNNIGLIPAENGVTFAASAQASSSYDFNPRNGQLTIDLKNDISFDVNETLATININISKNSNPTDILRCSPVFASIVYADNSSSGFTIFEPFERKVLANYDFNVKKRIVGAPGEIMVTNLDGTPLPGATVYALGTDLATVLASAITDANGIASNMDFTNTAQPVNIFAELNGKYTFTRLIRTLTPHLTNAPSYIRSGTTPDPQTSKTFTWATNPILSEDVAIIKLAKKVDGETNFQERAGITKILEYNAVASSGVIRGNAVTVNNLQSGTEYIYQVGDGKTWSPTRTFRTTENTNKFSFGAFGDLQASSIDMMNRLLTMGTTLGQMQQKPFFNLNVGDINDTDDRYDYVSFYGHLLDQSADFGNIDMISAYGNHEYMGTPDADNIKFLNGHHTVEPSPNYDARIVGTGSHAVEYGNMLVISLDWEHKGVAPSTAMMTEQAKWLEEILSKTDKTWKVVTMHYPIYPYASTAGSQSIIAPVLDKYNVQVVFCGHGHTFERVQVYNGSPVVPYGDKRTVTPGIGGTLYFQLGDSKITNASGRWILCEVNGKRMDVIVRDANNNIVSNECFTLYASPLEKYTVSFNPLNDKGTLTATVDGNTINTGDLIEEGKEIIFTATPNNGYKIKEWKINNIATGESTLTHSLKDLSGETTVTVEFELDNATDIETDFIANVSVFPNPFSNNLNISGAENTTLKIVDIAGISLVSKKINGKNEQIQLNQLLTGVYFLKLEKNGKIKTVKIIKQ